MNPEFFDRYDTVMNILLNNGITAYLYLRVYNKQVKYPKNGSAEDALYYRYIAARYQAYCNVIWDFSKEAFHKMDAKYKIDTIRALRTLDAHRRLITVHDDKAMSDGNAEFASLLDFYTAQQHSDYYMFTYLQYHKKQWPITMVEFGYEYGPGGPSDIACGYGQSPYTMVERAWEVVFGGGFPNYYFTYTAWDIIDRYYTPVAVNYFKILYEFMVEVAWYRFTPRLEPCVWQGRCMADGDKRYLVYLNQRSATLNLPVYGRQITVTFLNIITGQRIHADDKVSISQHIGDIAELNLSNPFKGEYAHAVALIEVR